MNKNGDFCYVPERIPPNWYRKSTPVRTLSRPAMCAIRLTVCEAGIRQGLLGFDSDHLQLKSVPEKRLRHLPFEHQPARRARLRAIQVDNGLSPVSITRDPACASERGRGLSVEQARPRAESG